MLNPSVFFATAFTLAALLALFPMYLAAAALVAAILLCAWCLKPAVTPALWGACLGGLLTYGHYMHWQYLVSPAEQDKQTTTIDFVLTDFIKPTERGWLLIAQDKQGRNLRLSWPGDQQDNPQDNLLPAYDCQYQATVQLRRPRGLLNHGLFDYEAWLLSQRFHATGTIKRISSCEQHRVEFWLARRLSIANWLAARADSPRVSATLNGLLIGNYADLARSDWQQLRETGTIHLLSVSGLHIALVAGLVGWLTLRLVRSSCRLTRVAPAILWASVAALIVASAYSLLAGFSVPTQRSVIMVAAACLCVLARSRWPWSQAFCWAVVCVLVINPFSLLSVGFWFSFSATAIVLLAAKYTQPAQTNTSLLVRSWRHIRELTVLQGLLFAAMLPLLFYSYGRVYGLSLPMNLLAVPWVSFISLPLAFIAAALLPFSQTAADGVMNLAAQSLAIYWAGLDWATQSPLNLFLQAQAPALWQVTLAWFALCFWIMLPRNFLPKHLLLLTLLPLWWPRSEAWGAGELRVSFLDVGQGLAIIVQTEHHTLLYDTGNRYSESFDAGRDLVLPSLAQLGRDLDVIIISHNDSDHAAGLAEVLRQISAPVFAIDPDGLRQKFALLSDQAIQPCERGLSWQFDQIKVAVISPESNSQLGKNASCVLLLESPHGRVLLTGDMERGQELALFNTDVFARELSPALPMIAISAPHHGSNTSSTASLLSTLKPEVAVISAGYLNRYQHPTENVLARYQQYGVASLNSAELGQVQLTLNSTGAKWRSALCDDRSIWRKWRREAHGMCDTSENFVK